MTTDDPDGPYDLSALSHRNDAREPIAFSRHLIPRARDVAVEAVAAGAIDTITSQRIGQPSMGGLGRFGRRVGIDDTKAREFLNRGITSAETA
jgi:hypothetical protein